MADDAAERRPSGGADRPTLYIHVGAGKTGSSTIQEVLAANRQRLAELGVLIPDNELQFGGKTTGTQVPFFVALWPITSAGHELIDGRIEYLERGARHRSARAVIISAENLFHRKEFGELFRNAHRHFDVCVIAYIRRQDDFLMSRWAQWDHKVQPDFASWASARPGDAAADWNRQLTGWEQALPEARIVVRVFDRNRLVGGDVARDFLEIVGIDPAEIDLDATVEKNQRLNEIALRVSARNRGLTQNVHDNRFANFLREVAPQSVSQPTPTGLMWNREDRQAVVSRFAESNEEVRKRYFPDLPEGGLFSSDFPEDRPSLTEREQLELELDMLWTAIFHSFVESKPKEGKPQGFARRVRSLYFRVRHIQLRP